MTTPLATLLSQALIARTRRLEAAGPPVPLPMWANLLRVADGDVKQLHTQARVSKRAMKTMLKLGERRGWLVDGGTIARTDAGRELDATWCAVVDADRDDALRAALEPIVAALPLELPHYPIGYGTADPRLSGGNPHGQDWRPVPRCNGDTVSALPVVSLLGQALAGLTLDYEQRTIGSLGQAANVLRLVGDDGLPLAAIDPAAGVAGNGKSNLERHGFLTVNRDKVVFLTAAGWRVRENYESLLADIERGWRERHDVDALVAALEPAPDLAHHPIVPWGPNGFSERSVR